MLELLFLLLPVAAAYGWYMGRRSAQQNKQDEANRLSRDYVAGVNFLLSNQQDKADRGHSEHGHLRRRQPLKAAGGHRYARPVRRRRGGRICALNAD